MFVCLRGQEHTRAGSPGAAFWECWGLQEGLVPTAGWRWGAPALWAAVSLVFQRARPAFCWLAARRAYGFAACRINTMFVLRNGFQQDMVNINSQVGQMHNSSPSTLRRLCLSHD